MKYNVLNVYDMYKLETGVLCISIEKAHFLMASTTSLLQGLKYMITLDIKIIIIKQEMLEPFQITQSELMGQYVGVHLITMSTRKSNSIKHLKISTKQT